MLETRSSEFYFTKKVVKAKGKGSLVTNQVDRINVLNNKGIFRAKMSSALQALKSRRAVENDENKNKTQANLLLKILSFLQADNRGNNNIKSIQIPKEPINDESDNSPNIDQVKKEIQNELDKKNSRNLSIQTRQDFAGRRKRSRKVLFDPVTETEDWFYEKSIVTKLTPHSWFLKILKSQTHLFYNHKKVLMLKNYRETKIITIFFFLIYNIKTFVLISLRKLFENDLFLLIFRGGFCIILIVTLLAAHQFTKNRSIIFKRNCSYIVLFCYLYGLASVILEIQYTGIKEDFLIAFLELMIICLVYTNIW